MAKKHTWKARPADAIDLATLRWYAVTMEKLAIEIYATDRSRFADLDQLLRGQLGQLSRFGAGASAAVTLDDDCPNGWFLCKDGLCAPACNELAFAARKGGDAMGRRGGRKRG
jgi:hypothetical protein